MAQNGGVYEIVIVGGGAGGLELATRLGRRYGRDPAFRVTLVDRTHSHLWKPLLHEVAAGTLNSNDDELSYLAQAHWSNFRFILGPLSGLDRERREIVVGASYDKQGRQYIPQRRFRYDTLVIAIGSVTNDFGIPGVADHCLFLDSREQADAFHQHLMRACYEADAQGEPVRRGQLHVAIAGGGATGVELAAELQHSLTTLVGFGLDNIDVESDIHIDLIEGADRILPGLAERVSRSTTAVLESLGIAVHTGARIASADAYGFELDDGKRIPASIKVWAAGIRADRALAALDGLEVNHVNQLVCLPTLQTTRDENVFALGDCAACPLGDEGAMVPPRAQAAHQQASHMLRVIDARLQGKPLPVYEYRDFGSLINLSRHTAVGTLMGNLLNRGTASFPIEGMLARWAYLSLYKMHQFAVNGIIRTALTTIADLLTRASKPRLKLH